MRFAVGVAVLVRREECSDPTGDSVGGALPRVVCKAGVTLGRADFRVPEERGDDGKGGRAAMPAIRGSPVSR